MTHATSWPTMSDWPKREVRPPASVFSPHNAETVTDALSLLRLFGEPSSTSPIGLESGFAPESIALAKKGKTFIDALFLRRNLEKARHAVRINRRSLTYNRVSAMHSGEEYLSLLDRYRERVRACRGNV